MAAQRPDGPARGGTAIGTNSNGAASGGAKRRRSPPAVKASPTSVDLSGLAELRAILRIRPFRRLWLVLSLTSLADWIGLLATSIFAAEQVTDPAAKGFAFGAVIAVRLLPALILGPVAGVIADRFDRRLTMVACDIARFVLFASIPTVALVAQDAKIAIGWTAVAVFLIEAVGMVWAPAKEAAVPNLLPRPRLEKANQVSLATTYGITPVLAALALAGATTTLANVLGPGPQSWATPTNLALYFNALTRLLTALVVFFGIKEISGRATAAAEDEERETSLLRDFWQGWAYVGKTPLVRGLVSGMLGAFGGAGIVIGTAQFYAQSLGGGASTFYVLFAVIFAGLGVGIVGGPRIIGALSRRRWFGMSIVFSGLSVTALGLSWHLTVASLGALCVGIGAGMAFLSGTTLLMAEVGDEVRGRVFAFIQTATRFVLILSISMSGFLVGLGGSHQVEIAGLGISVSSTRLLLIAAGVFGALTGLAALRQMDDKPGVPFLADLVGSVRGRPLGVPDAEPQGGLFVVFEGGEGAGKSTQVRMLAEALRAKGLDAVVTREPGATDIGGRIRRLVLESHGERGGPVEAAALSSRAEALLYAADRAHHVSTVVRPALERGAVVISDRYVDSSLAYQGVGRTLPMDEVSWLSTWATGGLKPALVVLLDVDPTVGLSRVSQRGTAPDRLESESLEFHERVRCAFLDLAAAEPTRYLVLDAARPAQELHQEVLGRIEELLPPGAPQSSLSDDASDQAIQSIVEQELERRP